MTAVDVDTEIDEPAEARPKTKSFLRWTGSKRALVPELLKWVPERFTTGTLLHTYHEPFMGSAALFFALRPARAVLSDANNWLTCTFSAIQNDVEAVLPPLRIYAEMYTKHGAPFYLHARDSIDPDLLAGSELAAWFVFMNKTGFNGLWRVNRAGKYNIPPGKFAKLPTVCDEALLRACSTALAGAMIVNSGFRAVEQRAQPGDFVYFDPPYIPTSHTADFTSYTAGGFTPEDQVALRDLALRLKRRGVDVALSNSDTPVTRDLYQAFEIREITRSGGINSDPTKRGRVTELLIR